MTQGGSGFQSGDDFVALRVNMEIPTEGLSSIKELSQAMERMRAIAEAGAKTNQTYVGYLQQMAQAARAASEAHLQLEQQLQRNADLQNRVMGGSGAASQLPMSRAVPQGYTDNFSGMGSGMGGARQGSPSDVPNQMQMNGYVNSAYGANPQQYVNAQAGRYRMGPGQVPTTPTGAPDWQSQAQTVYQRDEAQQRQAQQTPDGSSSVRQNLGSGYGGGGLGHNLMNEMAVGGSLLGMGRHVADAMGSRDNPDGGGGGGGGFGGMLKGLPGIGGMLGKMGPAGAIAGGALAGLGLVERGGGMYQDYKNMGLIRGGGAGEGFESEMAIRSLALNPFLSNDQSRQVIMAGLTEGYSGKAFDNVTQYLASNLKDMNVSVADSVKLLRTSILGGENSFQATAGVSSTLATIKELSKSGISSSQDLTKSTGDTMAALIAAGVPADQARQEALSAAQTFNNEDARALKGEGGDYVAAVVGSSAGQLGLEGMGGMGFNGLPPAAAAFYATRFGGGNAQQGTGKLIQSLFAKAFQTPASRSGKDPKAYTMAVYRFQVLLKTYAEGSPGSQSMTEAANLADQYLGGKNPFQQGDQEKNAANAKVTGQEGLMSQTGEAVGAIGNTFSGLGRMFAAGVTMNDQAAINAADDIGKGWTNADYYAGAGARNNQLDKIVGLYGADNIQVVDKNGNASDLNKGTDQVRGLADGSLRWKRKGEQGNGYLVTDASREGSSGRGQGGGGGNTNVGVNFSPATVQIKFDNSGVTASPNPVQLTPNQQQANAGYGSATMNNPPPGDGFGYYQGRYGFGAGGGGSSG